MKKLLIGVLAAGLGLTLTTAKAAEGVALPKQDWSFGGILGTFDRAALQRGLQVYREVCSGCHSVKYIAFRNLSDLGYTAAEIAALALEVQVVDGPNDEGEMFERDGRASDHFPAPFPNKQAAAAANNGAVPPDLSLMAKARKGGPDYTYAVLTGYEEPPADFVLMDGLNYNKFFPGHQIAMAAPLFEGGVEYADGTEATVEQMAHDVTTFLMWTAEPKLEIRKAWGVKVVIFVFVLTVLLGFVKRRVWADVH
jgi:ubiquinol-cytochrome c reductase cytochrome c1 subunit